MLELVLFSLLGLVAVLFFVNHLFFGDTGSAIPVMVYLSIPSQPTIL